jgi:hypothetical protein
MCVAHAGSLIVRAKRDDDIFATPQQSPLMGIEPMTIRLRSACSTNWAKEAADLSCTERTKCAWGGTKKVGSAESWQHGSSTCPAATRHQIFATMKRWRSSTAHRRDGQERCALCRRGALANRQARGHASFGYLVPLRPLTASRCRGLCVLSENIPPHSSRWRRGLSTGLVVFNTLALPGIW